MFGWLDKIRGAGNTSAIPEITQHTDLGVLWQRDTVLLFKHSSACPVSWAAHAQVIRFIDRHKSVPVFLIPVIKERAASRRIADLTGVRHESPQVILLKNGVAAESASHGAITVDRLATMVGESAWPTLIP